MSRARVGRIAFPPGLGCPDGYDTAAADNTNFYTSWGDNRLSTAPDVMAATVPIATFDVGPAASVVSAAGGASAGSAGAAGDSGSNQFSNLKPIKAPTKCPSDKDGVSASAPTLA